MGQGKSKKKKIRGSSISGPEDSAPPSSSSVSHFSSSSTSVSAPPGSYDHSSTSAPAAAAADTGGGSPHKGGSSSKDGFNIKRLEELFNSFKDTEEDRIGPTGIEKFCHEIEVDPEDVRMLVLAFHLNAQEMGYFSKDEFMQGFQKMSIDTIKKVQEKFKQFTVELEDPNKYKDLFRFAFSFAKEADQKCLDLETAKGMLALLMGEKFPHTSTFVDFLGQQSSYKVLNLDQWMSFLEFSKTIRGDFTNYDENGAWPVLLDEFVEWSKNRKS